MNIGDRVKIVGDLAAIDHRSNRYGIITKIDGAYHYVRPMWCKWTAEFYEWELEGVKRPISKRSNIK